MSDAATLRPHPAAEIFPLMADAEIDALVSSIRTCGLIEPITLHEGMILDGRHRLRACLAAGVAPRFVEWAGRAGSEIEFVNAVNGARRHLTLEQRALAAAKAKALFEAQAAARRRASQNNNAAKAVPAPVPEQGGEAREKAAAMFGVSPRTVQDASAILKSGTPDEVAAVERGEAAIRPTAEAIRDRMSQEVEASEDSHAKDHRGIRVPEGMTAEQVCRRGMAIEADGVSTIEAAAQIGVGVETYRRMRAIVLLSDRTDLSPKEATLVRSVLVEMNATNKPRLAFERIKDLRDRVWGKNSAGQNSTPQKAEARRLADFDRAVGFIAQTCAAAREIDIPYLNAERVRGVTAELRAARKHLADLMERIEGGRQ